MGVICNATSSKRSKSQEKEACTSGQSSACAGDKSQQFPVPLFQILLLLLKSVSDQTPPVQCVCVHSHRALQHLLEAPVVTSWASCAIACWQACISGRHSPLQQEQLLLPASCIFKQPPLESEFPPDKTPALHRVTPTRSQRVAATDHQVCP